MSMLTLAGVWEPLALFYLGVMIGIPYLHSIAMKLSVSVYLAQWFCVIYFQMKKKSNQETELGSSKTFPRF